MQIRMKVKDRIYKYFVKLTLFSLKAHSARQTCRSDWRPLRGGAEHNNVARNVASIKNYSRINWKFYFYVLTPAPILPQHTLHFLTEHIIRNFNNRKYLVIECCLR